MTQAETLYRLQEIDLNALQAQKRLNEIAAALSDNQRITAAQAQVSAAQAALTPLQTKSRNLELEVQSNTDKIRQTDEALYSGRVRNPKELQDMQQEIQSLKSRNSDLEDTLLETMLLVESAEAELKARQVDLDSVRTAWETEHQHLLDEQTQLKADIITLRQRREQLLPEVAEDSLKTYNALKPRKNNQPIALLVDRSCSVCRVEQEMAVIAETRKGQKLTTCSSCGRILAYHSG
jgi:uncharacterized protein